MHEILNPKHRRVLINGFSSLLRIRMASRHSIKLFQFNKKFCQTAGIFVRRSNQSRCTFLVVKLALVICMAQYAIATAAFIVYDAKSMDEYTATIFILLSAINTASDYSFTVCKMEHISKFTENCEALIEKSE